MLASAFVFIDVAMNGKIRHAVARRLGCAVQALVLASFALMQGTEVCFCSPDENGPCEECAHGYVHGRAADEDSSSARIESAECDHLKIEMPEVVSVDSDVHLPLVVLFALTYPREQDVSASCVEHVPPCATSPPDPGGVFVDYSVRALQRS